MGHLARRRHIGEEHKTAHLLHLAGNDLHPLVECDLEAIPQRFHYAGLLLTRPSWAILGVLLDLHLYVVIRALLRPQLGGGSLSIGTAEILLLGHLACPRIQRRRGRLELTLELLLPSLILAAGVHHDGPID